MKTKSIERELRALYKQVCNTDEECEEAVRQAIKAYSLVRQEVSYQKTGDNA